ncbi:MAG: hypothetical protein LDL29_05750 [Dechloromonas sp.]|nr:hypothetical protein [Dechloromonas sp.]
MPSPILARADALMQRRHLNTTDSEDVPVLTDALPADDIPTLFDVENPPPAKTMPCSPAIQAETRTEPADISAAEAQEAIIRELSQQIIQRLNQALPTIIEATIRDYLAEQEMR